MDNNSVGSSTGDSLLAVPTSFKNLTALNSVMNSDGCWDNENSSQLIDERSNMCKENGVKKFKVKSYIPEKSAIKYLELPYIIGIAIIVILTTIIIILSISNKSVECDWPKWPNTQEGFLKLSGEIVTLDKNRFFIYDPVKANLKLLLEVKNPVQFFRIDASRKTLFWIEANSSNIFSLHLLGEKTEKDINLIFDEARVKPGAIALDSFTNNLYIVDESISGLIVINVDTKHHTLLLVDLVNPRYIVLDVEKEIIFVGSTKEIMKVDMDSRNLMRIANGTNIATIALDRDEKRVYWISDYKVINRCDYFGQFVEKIVVEPAPVLDLTFLDGHLFWLRKPRETRNATLWSCKVQNGTCHEHMVRSNAVNSSALESIPSRAQQNTRHQNTRNEERCEHISLATPSGPMSCVCSMGFQLVSEKICDPITKFMLYTLDNFTRSRALDGSRGIVVEPFWPTSYRAGNLSFKADIHFDFDVESSDFYFSDDEAIYKIKLNGKNPQQEVVLASNDFYIEDLAYDWLTGNMYYIKRSKVSGNILLAVFNVKKGPSVEKILENSYYVNHLGRNGLALYPSRGIIFLAAIQSPSTYIYQTATNGTLITKFRAFGHYNANRLIALDYDENRVYWISSESSINHANFDGSDNREIYRFRLRKAKTISISGEWMYVSGSTSVCRVNKKNGYDYTLITPTNDSFLKVSGVRIINQPQVIGNPCRMNNGDCEQFCFYGQSAMCDCADGLNVTSQGTCK